MKQSEKSFERLLKNLEQLRRRALLVDVLAGVLLALAVGSLSVLVWVGAEALLFLSPPWRVVLGLVAALAAVVVLPLFWRTRLPVKLNRHRFGLHVEQCCPQLAQRLISALELWRAPRARQLYSEELLDATVIAAAAELAVVAPESVCDGPSLKRNALRLGGAAAVGLLAALAFAPELSAALYRCAHPLTVFERPPRTEIRLAIDAVEVVRGEDVRLVVHFFGERPTSARILRRESPQASWEGEEVVVAGADSLHYTFPQVQRSFSVRVEAGGGVSEERAVSVIDPPSVERLRLRLRYPAYSQLPDRIEEDGGDIQALVGTQLLFEIAASKALTRAELVLADSVHLAARVDGTRAFVELAVERSTSYHVELFDRKGIANRDPIRYALRAVVDQPPSVVITDPGRDMDLPENRQVLVAVEAGDDFGVAELELAYQVNEGGERRLPLASAPGREVRMSHIWDVSHLELLPEDRIHYYVEVFDNDEVSGPKSTRSRRYTLRLASLHELYEEAEDALDERLEELEELAEQGKETRGYLEQVRRELLRSEEMSWEKEKELEATLARESERTRQLEELSAQLGESAEALDEKGLGSEDLLEKLEEIRQLMAEVAAPELHDALRQLQQAAADPDPQALAEALKRFNEDQEAFQERLDRTIDLLKQVRAEQQLEAAVRQAEELAQRQQQINEELEQSESGLRQQTQEGGLRRDSERLQKDLNELAEAMESMSQQTARELAEQAEAMKSQNMSGRMREMVQQMRAQNNPQAKRLGAGLEEDLGKLAANLKTMQGEFVAEEKEEMSGQLRRAMRELIQLSRHQEALAEAVRAVPQIDGPEPAEDQFALFQGMGLVTERLAQVARRTMSLARGLNTTLGYALKNMAEASQHLGQRDGRSALAPQEGAMRYLNESVVLLRESLDNLSNASMPSSFAEAMQKMMGLSEQQAQLNQAGQQAMADAMAQGPGKPQPGLDGQLRRLASEQRRIYQALEDLQRSMRGHKGAEGQIEAIQEEMREVLGELQQRRLDQRTLQKQERIFQRMLDASRSIHSRGFKEERQARGGEDQPYAGPPGLSEDLGQMPDLLRQAMRRALEGEYPAEYRVLLQRYYEQVYQDALGTEVLAE
ncbi:MAG: hypothetical protein ACI906_004109 [Candidatus Latescibacterota bacterium]|jgi:hypothetical protein